MNIEPSRKSVPVSGKVRTFLADPRRMLIDGCWVMSKSGKLFNVLDPSTGEVIATVAEGCSADVDSAVLAARRAFDSGDWTSTNASVRGRLLWRLADLLEANADEFAELESLNSGKPISVARAADVPLAIEVLRYMAGWATKIEGSTRSLSVPYAPGAEFFSYTLKQPIGVVGQIIPWNFPLLMAAWKLAPALAVGCTIVLKPAEQTPLTALRLGELVIEAGFPRGVVNIVPGYGDSAGAALAQHANVDKIAFTGSTDVGRMIVRAAGESNLKKVTLELGGKSPNVIFADADIEQAIIGASNAIFFNHGQCCTAGSRLYVERSQYDRVVEGVARFAGKIRLGPGLDGMTEMGPLVSEEQRNKVCGLIDSGVSDGAETLIGGKACAGAGYFVEPTVMVKVSHRMSVVNEEIFGPVLVVMPFDSVDEISVLANSSRYGLAAGVWTKDIGKAHRLARILNAGNVWINCYNIFDACLPFGGFKQSGWGREMGHEALDLYTEVKSVTVRV